MLFTLKLLTLTLRCLRRAVSTPKAGVEVNSRGIPMLPRRRSPRLLQRAEAVNRTAKIVVLFCLGLLGHGGRGVMRRKLQAKTSHGFGGESPLCCPDRGRMYFWQMRLMRHARLDALQARGVPGPGPFPRAGGG